MGGKRTGAGKPFYFCLACLILLSGCAPLSRQIAGRSEARESLTLGEKLFAQGDYGGALREHQTALSLSAKGPPVDHALFNLGLIYAHPDNPQKDYAASVVYFRQVIGDYPGSPWVPQAEAWLHLLEENGGLTSENHRLEKEVAELNQAIEKSKQIDIELEQKRREQTE